MKQLTIFLLAIVCSSKTFSQAYVPMPMQNCYWQMSHSNFCSQATGTPAVSSSLQVYQIYPNSDTIISTIKYVKFYSQVITNNINSFCGLSGGASSGYWGAVRQDTLGKKVFTISPNQTSEQLLYNFNYIKGDTVKTSLGIKSPPPPSGDLYRIVDSIYYSAYSDGICRKTFRLKPYVVNIVGQYVWYTYFTEGIGNDVGLGETVLSISQNNFNSITTEHWTSFLTINSSTISAVTTNTCSQVLGLKNNYYKTVIDIYPNPAHNEITLNLENQTIENYRIIVCDLLGNEILTPTNKTFKVDSLTNGTYIIKCFNVDTKEVMVTKFIKE